jgi:hypothetical protein
MVVSVFRRLKDLIHELGAWTAALYLISLFLRRIDRNSGVFFYHFLAQPLAAQSRLAPHRGKAFTFRILTAAEPVLEVLSRPTAVIDNRFAQGAQCLAAFKNEGLVGCIWFIRGAYEEDEVRAVYALPDGSHCVWDFDVFVAEAERLGFLFAKQWDAFDKLLRPQGVRFSVSRVNAFNQRSLASHLKMGAKKCGWALFLRIGTAQWMLSDRRPYISFGGQPTLHVGPDDPIAGQT